MMKRRRRKNKEENQNLGCPLNKFWQDSQEQRMSLFGFYWRGVGGLHQRYVQKVSEDLKIF
jgi:hypothetical protein